VWAIDISQKGVELIRVKAAANGVADCVVAEVRNCYGTDYPARSFDLIYGGGVLHHLDVPTAGVELNRILRPDGVAVFFEPIRDTKVMDVIRAVVLRLLNRKLADLTENESPMTTQRLLQLSRYFKVVRYRHFNVLTSVGLVLDSPALKSLLAWADLILMTIVPGFRKLGRAVVIELREPIADSSGLGKQ
jgi:SAM-dependent methyltransferase